MSFGGAVSAMVTSIKNNARPKRKTVFEKGLSSTSNSKLKRFKRASPKELATLREKLKQSNKIREIKLYGLTFAVLVLLFFMLHIIWKYKGYIIKDFLA